jgi:N6-adenosine-specific RNA methylase IME4
MKFQVICADPPWFFFFDELSMSDVKRGASANYDTLSISDLKNLPVSEIAAEDAVLVLWCPSSLLSDGLALMEAWGFRQTQTHIWIKTKKAPLRNLKRELLAAFKQVAAGKAAGAALGDILTQFDLGSSLGFGMGRLFRQTHELALVGVRGKVYSHLENKSQRSVHFFPTTKHSVKPEALQEMLEKMFPEAKFSKLELFARRQRLGWICVGNEAPMSKGEDIRQSIEKLKLDMSPINNLIYCYDEGVEEKMQEVWSEISIKP